jgi:hypothetical protein
MPAGYALLALRAADARVKEKGSEPD